MRELRFLNSEEEIYEIALTADRFDLVGEGSLFESLRDRFYEKIDPASHIKLLLSMDYISDFIDQDVRIFVRKDRKSIFESKPIFVIGIPKGGTHLLFELVEKLGYLEGRVLPSDPKPSHWYFMQGYHAHTECKKFFVDFVYETFFGGRWHPFPETPVIFIYRHPLDILVSEANYYHRKGKTLFYNYFYGMDFDERVSVLIDDYLLGSIRDRVMRFSCWLRFPNVIPVSFEELVGEEGGGDKTLQLKAVWSIMLKLEIEGKPEDISRGIYNVNSPTFNKGKIGSFKSMLKKEHLIKVKSLNQDFMEIFGYDYDSVYSVKLDEFRKRKLILDEIERPPYLCESNFLGFQIVRDEKGFFAALDGKKLLSEYPSVERLKIDIIRFWLEHFLKDSKE